ncbi:MAG: C_GCAxxG_C_C family protein [Anaerolineae bacterium]|nr:C_GCAxxG_C_C family protein [Anaerolineae bacterium]
MTEAEAIAKARSYFLRDDNLYGCAETTYMVLAEAFGLPGAADSSLAMALNGGVAWWGEVCGAITGAALAVGQLAGCRIADHKEAKRTARRILSQYMEAFRREWGAVDCRTLVGCDIRTEEGHRAFIEGGLWRDVCMRQIAFAVRNFLPLADGERWAEVARQAREGA